MPILESKELAYRELRVKHLAKLSKILKSYKDGFVISGPVWEYFSSNASNDNLNLDKMNEINPHQSWAENIICRA
mgnify:CR=1 FL=1